MPASSSRVGHPVSDKRWLPVKPDTPHGTWIATDVPGRLDALGWSRWHRRVIVALGITWILDGLEASLVANLAPTLEHRDALGLSGAEVGFANTSYLVGQVIGALVFGHLTDRLGRKRLFLVTLALYLVATALSGFAPSYGVFLVFRLFAGAGIGGEYAAINSAIDELVPARIRGQIDLAINGSYWVGVALGAVVTLIVLDPDLVPIAIGWRLAFGLGALLGLAILLVQHDVPESPRWLLMHGHVQAAIATVERIEADVRGPAGSVHVEATSVTIVKLRVVGPVGVRHLMHTLFVRYPRRTILGLTLMLAQAFLYNSIFFSYGLILKKFHGVPAERVGLYIIPFAAGNFLGPLLLGPLFDRVGRRIMIPATYALAGVLLLVTGGLFVAGQLDAVTQVLAWSVVFFVASAAASSAYLTVSELFPVELRGMAIAVFYAFGTLVGAGAPSLFGTIIDTGEPLQLFAGYALSSTLMIGAAIVARVFGVDAERRSLESITAEDPP
ncbi:MAG: MFS transporter [Deltaproteobacteria bacterium]|nr:MFS transporter [Deltaproteobacteria bacterium]